MIELNTQHAPLDQAIALLLIYIENRKHRSKIAKNPLDKSRECFCDKILSILHDYRNPLEDTDIQNLQTLLVDLLNTAFYRYTWRFFTRKYDFLPAAGYKAVYTNYVISEDMLNTRKVTKKTHCFKRSIQPDNHETNNLHFDEVLKAVYSCLVKVIIDALKLQHEEKNALNNIPNTLYEEINRAARLHDPEHNITPVFSAGDLYGSWIIQYNKDDKKPAVAKYA